MSVSNNHHLDSEHFALGDPKLFCLFLIIGLTPDIICATLGPSLYSQLISSDIMSDKALPRYSQIDCSAVNGSFVFSEFESLSEKFF